MVTLAAEVRVPQTTTNDGLAIDLHDVAKVYKGRVHALQGIEMLVRRGEVFGLLGPNGAGKSTLVKIMMTVVRATRSHGTVLGAPVGDKATLRRVGYLPENHRFPRYLTGRQTIEFFAALQKVDKPTRRRRAAELLETVGMTAWADSKIATYSKGMMQRIGLAQALAADPDLVLLDEPTDGVDPVGRRDIRDVLQRLRSEGKTVFINSHLLSELEMICDRVAILVQGRVARQGTIAELTVNKQRYDIEVDAAGGDPMTVHRKLVAALPAQLKEVPQALPAAPGVPFAAPVGAANGSMPPGPMPGGLPPHGPVPGGPIPQGPLQYGAAHAMAGPPPHLGRSGPPPQFGSPPMQPPMPPATPAWVGPLLRGTLSNGTDIEVEGLTARIATSDAAAVQPILDALRSAGLVIRKVVPVRQSLEDLFMEAVVDPRTGQAAAPGAARMGGRP